MAKKQEEDTMQKDIGSAAVKAAKADIPHLYCNGFVTVLTGSDTLLVLKTNENSIATINMSYTIAKTLSIKLGGLIKSFENTTGNKIMTTDDIAKHLNIEPKDAN